MGVLLDAQRTVAALGRNDQTQASTLVGFAEVLAFRPQGLTVYAVYPQHRQSSLLVRALSDFMVECFREADA